MTGRWAAAAGTILLVLAGGCATTPAPSSRDPGVPLPEQWSSAPGASEVPAADGWLSRFDDPRLEGLVEEALERNTDLRAAAARVRQAEAAARIAGADRLPQLGAGTRAQRQRTNFFGLNVPGAEDGVLPILTSTFGVSLEVSWEADLWGRLRAADRAALADRAAARASFRGARMSVAGQTAKAWFAASAAAEQLTLAGRTLASYRESLDGIERRYRSGLVEALDLRLTRTNVANAEALVAARRRQLAATVRQLEILLGRYPAAELDAPGSLPGLPGPVPAGLPADIVDRRPDVLAARLELAAADARLVESRKALYPRLSLTGSGGTSTPELADLLDGDFRVWSLVANLTQPIFQGGRLRANVDAQRARSEETLARYAGTLLSALGEVEEALDADARLAEREQALAVASEEAAAAEALAQRQYREGLVDILTLLETQRRALAAKGDEIAVRRERLQNRVDLHLALGGDFTAPPPAPADVSQEISRP
jgi:NodT family efflux transporter outer membrane factor (OMF) lipoprotein